MSEPENEISDISADGNHVFMLEEVGQWNEAPSTMIAASSSVIVPVSGPSTASNVIVPRQGSSMEVVSVGQLALPSAENSLTVALPDNVTGASTNGNLN